MSNNFYDKQKTDYVKALLSFAENGDEEKLKCVLNEDKAFSSGTIDNALRKCINCIREPKDKYYNCIRLLLEQYNGLNVKYKDDKSFLLTIKLCFEKCDKTLIDIFLMNENILANIYDDENNCFLHYLIQNKSPENDIIDIINKISLNYKNIDFNHSNNKGYNPLSYALIIGYPKLADFLIKNGASKNHIIKSTGDNMLHCAVIGKNIQCIKLLEDINPSHKNINGLTPIDKADDLKLNFHIKKLLNSIAEKYSDNNEESFLTQLIQINEQNMSTDVWNILLFQYYVKKYYNINNVVQKFFFSDDEVARIKSKLKDNYNEEKNFEQEFINFFQKSNNYSNISENILQMYNYRLILFKLADFKSVLKSLSSSNNFLEDNYEIYFNSSLIFIEICLHFRLFHIADIIIQHLEEISNSSNLQKKKDVNTPHNKKYLEYCNFIEIIHKDGISEPILFVTYLFKAYRLISELRLDEARKLLKSYKKTEFTCRYKNDLPIFITLKVFYHSLKSKLNFHNGNFTKCYKQLQHLGTFSSSNDINSGNSESYFSFINTLGLINLKQKKYSLASFNFKNLINHIKNHISNKNFKTNVKYYYYAKYNLGLVYFYQKSYEKAYYTFNSILKYLHNNPFIRYRIAICCIEISLNNYKGKIKNNYNEIIDKIYGFYSGNDNKGNNESKSLKRILLRNFNTKNKNDFYKNEINEAICYLKQTICLLNDPTFYLKSYIKNFNNIYSQSVKSQRDLFDLENYNEKNYYSHITQNKTYSTIYVSCYTNLIFCLILREEWMEALFYINAFEATDFYGKENRYIFDNYKIECLINTNKIKEAIQIVELGLDNNVNDPKETFYNKTKIFHDVNFKISLYINLIKLHYLNNNLNEVDRVFNLLLSALNINLNSQQVDKNFTDLPSYIMNILIFYFLIKDMPYAALHILKKRKLNNNALKSILNSNLNTNQSKKIEKIVV